MKEYAYETEYVEELLEKIKKMLYENNESGYIGRNVILVKVIEVNS